jgi:hypothetical protein
MVLRASLGQHLLEWGPHLNLPFGTHGRGGICDDGNLQISAQLITVSDPFVGRAWNCSALALADARFAVDEQN